MDCPYPTEPPRNGELGKDPHNKEKCWNQKYKVYWSGEEWLKHLVKEEGKSKEEAYKMRDLMFRHGEYCQCSNAPGNQGKVQMQGTNGKYLSKAEWWEYLVKEVGHSSKKAQEMVDSMFRRRGIDTELSRKDTGTKDKATVSQDGFSFAWKRRYIQHLLDETGPKEHYGNSKRIKPCPGCLQLERQVQDLRDELRRCKMKLGDRAYI